MARARPYPGPTCGPPCGQLPGTGGSGRNRGKASSAVDLPYGEEPGLRHLTKISDPIQSPHPQGSECTGRIRLSLISQLTGEDGGRESRGWAASSSAEGYHSGGLCLTLGLHNLLPLFLLRFFHQELGPLGFLLSCGEREAGPRM